MHTHNPSYTRSCTHKTHHLALSDDFSLLALQLLQGLKSCLRSALLPDPNCRVEEQDEQDDERLHIRTQALVLAIFVEKHEQKRDARGQEEDLRAVPGKHGEGQAHDDQLPLRVAQAQASHLKLPPQSGINVCVMWRWGA